MLIDCGVYFRTPAITNPVTKEECSQEAWIKKIANHIKDATGSHIDVVAITHEHWDHVSGFHEDQARGSSSRSTSAASGWRGRRTCRSSWPAS